MKCSAGKRTSDLSIHFEVTRSPDFVQISNNSSHNAIVNTYIIESNTLILIDREYDLISINGMSGMSGILIEHVN